MEILTKKIDCIKMQAQIYDYLVAELYPVPECANCEYNFTRFSGGKCFKCDGASCYRLAEGIQSDVRKMVRGIVKIVKENN
jgi:protein-arginine kinase activator protein McsA